MTGARCFAAFAWNCSKRAFTAFRGGTVARDGTHLISQHVLRDVSPTKLGKPPIRQQSQSGTAAATPSRLMAVTGDNVNQLRFRYPPPARHRLWAAALDSERHSKG
jgi:hypothetical protein